MPLMVQPRVTAELLRKYDRPGPRYTSYPTAVEFHTGFGDRDYAARLSGAAAHPGEPLSLYLHLPFCEERCAFCGCMVIVTKKRDVAARYLDYLRKEIRLVASHLGDRRRVVQYHWGGGTPTYLSPAQMTDLHQAVADHFCVDPQAEIAIEADPRATSGEQIDLLRAMGFNRLSLGVQDFSSDVQRAIDRHQTEAQTRELFAHARRAGFDSINIDLVYGLPLQRLADFGRTLDAVVDLRPERIAVYSYAHVPWLRANQKRIDQAALPTREEKFGLMAEAIDRFVSAGYDQIGMDHFALPDDELARAAATRRLHRNFMGYTTRPATDLLGVGVSAIGDVRGAFAQNVKTLAGYYARLDAGRLPTERGYVLSGDDRVRRRVITALMCNFHVDACAVERDFGIVFHDYFSRELGELRGADGPVSQGFLDVHPDRLDVLPAGRPFVRNICMAFDVHLRRHDGQTVFSRTV